MSEWVRDTDGERGIEWERVKVWEKYLVIQTLWLLQVCKTTTYCTFDSNGRVHYHISICIHVCVCVCLLTSMHDQKDPCSNVCLCLIVYMCVRSLPQKGDETRYKLTLGSACCRFAQLSLAQVPWSDVELPVKQEAFKRWLESYGIACRNILKEVKHRGQRFPWLPMSRSHSSDPSSFLSLVFCLDCNLLQNY